MPSDLTSLDWTLVRSFLAVAETGSLSAAAARTGASQPTLGRHVRAIEKAMGTDLLRRHPRGYALTAAGEALLPAARQMAEAAARLARIAEAQGDQAATGTVRITASVFAAHFILPGMIARIRREHPGIEIELVPSDSAQNLLFGEADIAVRMFEPKQADVVTRQVGWSRFGLYAAHAYVAEHGMPLRFGQMMEHAIVGYDRSTQIIDGMRGFGFDVGRGDFAVRCDDQAAYWHLVVAGCGIGPGSIPVAAAEPRVIRVLPEVEIDPLPFWLTAHKEVRRIPRVDAVWRVLAEELEAWGV